MQDRNQIGKKVEEALNSLDGIRRAEANPFLFTRVQARWDKVKSPFEQVLAWAGKPAFAFLIIIVVLVTNLTVVLRQSAAKSAVSKEQTQLAVADEYHLDVPTLYDYENPEP